MRILIVGGGIASLTLAAFLHEHKRFSVEIVEKQKDWSHLGYTLGIWDVGRQILAKLDLTEEFDRHGKKINTYYLATPKNYLLKLYHFEDFYKKYETAYVHISRRILHDMLLKRSHSKVKMNTTIKNLKQLKAGIQVEFSNDTKKTYDLVIGADGVKSKVREQVFNYPPVYTGNRVWYCWVPKKFGKPSTVIETIANQRICSIFDDPVQTCMVLTAPEKPLSFDDPKTRIQRLREHFKEFPTVQEILNEIKTDELMPTDIAFVNTNDWIRGNVILIGDAAHAMEPFAGMGASLAMEDAYVLAEELAEMAYPEDLSKTLMRYKERRLSRVNCARAQTRELYWWTVSPIPGMSYLRNALSKILPISHFTKGYKILLETKP